MIEEPFPDGERQLLVVLVLEAISRAGDLDMNHVVKELHSMLSKLTGTDTVLVARRAYESHGLRLKDEQALDRARAAYHDPRFPERICDRPGCGKLYRGPAVYCSLECATADA